MATIMAPLAAVTMAGLLFVYARTSIRAAKLNAKKHREADGGQISWHKESLRRYGQIERVDDDRGTFGEALIGDLRTKKKKQQQNVEDNQKAPVERSENEAELRKIMGKKD
ncbi:CSEP effector [Pyrenophora seminiperda CCB06]|uniref:CSEP effector n=1 Tax=Pyrenophora seminiperda CCB06 TaxID=1302712 RepID=A0A3M7LVB4_9PLEO|nr:CSEP effector [Pyrenophora seminiperda CCB06]